MQIAPDAYARMLAHLGAARDRERCGLLFGCGTHARRYRPIDNIAADPQCRYEMHPQQLIAAMAQARACAETLVGIVHSHPRAPATPSAEDIAQASYPEAVYVIASLLGETPTVRGWRLRPGAAPQEEPLEAAGGA